VAAFLRGGVEKPRRPGTDPQTEISARQAVGLRQELRRALGGRKIRAARSVAPSRGFPPGRA